MVASTSSQKMPKRKKTKYQSMLLILIGKNTQQKLLLLSEKT